MNHKIFTTAFILFTGLVTPLTLSNADKHVTRLDKLAGYIQTHSTTKHDESYHIASALLTKGGSDVHILASIACVESNYTPLAVGDSGASVGMFQIQPLVWGSVPRDVYSQTSKARSILTHLKSSSHNYVARYNGSGSKSVRYSKLVMRTYKDIRRI